jgi:hypothetical protein
VIEVADILWGYSHGAGPVRRWEAKAEAVSGSTGFRKSGRGVGMRSRISGTRRQMLAVGHRVDGDLPSARVRA